MKKITYGGMLFLRTNFIQGFAIASLIILTSINSFAQKTSTGSGAWNVPGTWTPVGVPGTNDDVTILAGHTVTVPANAMCRLLFISGTLNMTGTNITFDISNNSVASPTNGIQLNAGSSLTIGSTNTVYFSGTQASGIVNNGGTIVSTGTNGVNGGTIRVNSCCGGEFRISGTSSTTVYNLDFLQGANFNIATAGFRVNGTLKIANNNWNSNGSAQLPIYGPGATLYISNNNQGLSGGTPLNNNLNKMWAVQTGTVGVTPGFPNNVTLVNMGTSSGGVTPSGGTNTNVGWRPSGAVGLGGTLSIGDGTGGLPNDNPTGSLNASLDQVTSFTSGGIIVDNNSILISPGAVPYTVKGDFKLQGATTGQYYNFSATTSITFAGSGTLAAPQVISTTAAAGTISFPGMTVSSGYVQLQDPVSTGTLALTGGIVGTSSTNPISVTNSSSTGVSGGSSTSFVDGPLKWTFPASPAGSYNLPVGDAGRYLPITLTSANSSSGTVVTAEAFSANSGGTRGDLDITALSTTEYWSVSTTNPFTSGATVDVARPTAVAPFNTLASSTTANGTYTLIGGSPSSATKISGGGISSTSPIYVVMVTSSLTVVRLGGTPAGVNGSCGSTSTGSLIVGGIGGTPNYTFSITSATTGFTSPAAASATFTGLAKGSYTVWIKDNNGSGVTRSSVLHVISALSINGNDESIDICPGQSASLKANNTTNSSATYSWSPATFLSATTGASVIASPPVTTTYTVTSSIINTNSNLIANGSFEGGSTPTGFTPNYILTAGPYGSTPDPGGFYKIGSAGVQLCTFFNSLPAQNGTNYLICDGHKAANNVFTLNLTLSAGLHRFSFWYAEGSDDIDPILETIINGVSAGSVTITNFSGWLQATYTFNAVAGANTITLRDNLAPGNTNGNDFYIDNIELYGSCTVSTSVQITVDCTLPVEFTNFNVEKQGQGALLTWGTATEKNSSHFIIEKSSDGISFSAIGQVKAAGNSSEMLNYYFTDPTLASGITYYRIAQYDLDGSVYYSEVKVVSKEDVTDILVVPNPNNGTFVIMLNGTVESETSVSLLNALGQIVYVSNGFTGNVYTVDISDLASGIYYMQVNLEGNTIVKKILKE